MVSAKGTLEWGLQGIRAGPGKKMHAAPTIPTAQNAYGPQKATGERPGQLTSQDASELLQSTLGNSHQASLIPDE